MEFPSIIQGGMGVGVSGWKLARAVSMLGQLGVVSGTALDVMLARRLQCGDPGGHMQRALARFPIPGVAKQVLDRYFVAGGIREADGFKALAMHSAAPPAYLTALAVAGNFVEVFLAREGHDGPVGINFLEKIQMPTLPSVYGAMLAGAAYVLMGAGIPRAIPGILDDLAEGRAVKLKLEVAGAQAGEEFSCHFDPQALWNGPAPTLDRPRFFGIISSATLAMTLARKSTGRVDGFVVEGPAAGGHNAPPRGPMQLSPAGEPIYGERDAADLTKIREVGLPFWLAGSFGRPGRLADAQALGARGIQVGTAFAFCEESGMDPELKRRVIAASRDGQVRVVTDPFASPTGFPFKVVQLDGSMADLACTPTRQRICDLGYLRSAYRRDDGTLGYRCPSEPVADYLRKGGRAEDTVGRLCVCNGLIATAGLGQTVASRDPERPLVTAGDDVVDVARWLKPGRDSYSAAEVIEALLG
jgi:NAD(P)H-dependent flavin oxidoreductase YrpB (nitropropane dioxygenase family)